uniref:Macaca fascicularis brain cDNA clone: QorA-10180, similar to human carnitine palmitoyltransferase II (CPT2), nuclear geneencoding mitochondrial protein, mRNA, RefSeq: NM_000098.1 n=1 Tax=Macaca fascicularis TaxID=9541 RepID=I7GL09_MACFA|nr:unnamed protein product [Macaca fascicularis]
MTSPLRTLSTCPTTCCMGMAQTAGLINPLTSLSPRMALLPSTLSTLGVMVWQCSDFLMKYLKTALRSLPSLHRASQPLLTLLSLCRNSTSS